MAAHSPRNPTPSQEAAVPCAAAPEPRRIPAPRVLPESRPFWEAAQEGRLLVKQCEDCGEAHFYPRDICPHCLSHRTAWRQADGLGTIYSFSTTGRGEAAYTIAFVTLSEGVTMMSNLVDCDPARLAVGRTVRVVFRESENGQRVPMFTLDQ